MIATTILTVFAIVLFAAMARALRLPALAVSLGIATYGLEQIVSIILPFFTVHQSAFNILIAVMIAGSFALSVDSRFVPFETKEGFDITLLLFAFVALFVVSILWSPSTNLSWVFDEIPYFAIYVVIIPRLVRCPADMLKSLRVLWLILAIGLLGTALSPMLLFSIAAARVVIGSGLGEMDPGANPLAFADTAVLLALTSTLFLLQTSAERCSSAITRTVGWLGMIGGIALGLSLAFISGRGETTAGLVSGAVLVILLTTRDSSRLFGRIVAGTAVFGGALFFAFIRLQDVIVGFAPRFATGNILIGVSVRGDLQGACIEAGMASATTIVFGLGANGCQALVGLYPHNELIQALAETGILGLTLLLMCYFFAFRFALRTIALAKRSGALDAVRVSALAISLMVYALLVANKRGVLTAPDSYMWVALSIGICDRARASLRPAVPASL